MQRDMKVGMAVGVALIGIVGALFFRREPLPKDKESPPPLQSTEDLDRRIGEKGKGPYMDGVEEFPDRAAPVPVPQNAGQKPSSKAGNAEPPRFLTSEEEARNRDTLSRKNAPERIQPIPTKKEETVATDNVPPDNRNWDPVGPAGKKAVDAPRSNPAGSASGPGRTHVIQAGETLSGLAARYLGSSARYREIYDANRNVLRSPDDLRDGVTIVIPDGGKPRDPQNVAGNSGTGSAAPPNPGARNGGVKARPTSRSVESDRDDVPAPTERLRFAPVRGGPFAAGRASGGGSSSRPDPAPARKSGTPRMDAIEEDQ